MGDGEGEEVKEEVLGAEAVVLREALVHPQGHPHLLLPGLGHPLLVNGEDHEGRPVGLGQGGHPVKAL